MTVVHSVEAKQAFAKYREMGYGLNRIASLLGVSRYTAKDWLRTYEAAGLEGLLNMGKKHTAYSADLKIAVVESIVIDGLSNSQAMKKYGVASARIVGKWKKIYREKGPEGLRELEKPADRKRYSQELRLAVVRSVLEEGLSISEAANKHSISSCSAIYDWVDKYNALGEDGLAPRKRGRPPSSDSPKHKIYPLSTRLKVARAVADEDLSVAEAAKKYGVSRSAAYSWWKKYATFGEDALKPERKQRSAKPATAEERRIRQLEEENRKLRCQLEVQKRLDALALQRLQAEIRRK